MYGQRVVLTMNEHEGGGYSIQNLLNEISFFIIILNLALITQYI